MPPVPRAHPRADRRPHLHRADPPAQPRLRGPRGVHRRGSGGAAGPPRAHRPCRADRLAATTGARRPPARPRPPWRLERTARRAAARVQRAAPAQLPVPVGRLRPAAQPRACARPAGAVRRPCGPRGPDRRGGAGAVGGDRLRCRRLGPAGAGPGRALPRARGRRQPALGHRRRRVHAGVPADRAPGGRPGRRLRDPHPLRRRRRAPQPLRGGGRGRHGPGAGGHDHGGGTGSA